MMNGQFVDLWRLSLAAVAFAFPAVTSAETLHWWRFEDSPGFTEDSVGGARLDTRDPSAGAQFAIPAEGRGANFPTALVGIGPNGFAADFLGVEINGFVARDSTPVTSEFTVEMFSHHDSLSHDGSAGTVNLAGQATGGNVSWLLALKSGELGLNIAGGLDPTILSGITLSEGVDYYLAASFSLAQKQVTFYVQDLTSAALLQAATVPHVRQTSLPSNSNFRIGNLVGMGVVQVADGLIDEVRVSNHVLSVNELLINNVLQEVGGDFDYDGDTDGNDFLKWQRGESPNPLSQSDLVAWQENFGNVASAMTAASTGVPEPSNIMLILGMAILNSARLRTRNSMDPFINRRISAVLACLLACSFCQSADASPVKVFLLAGQSNMGGLGQASELLPPWDSPQDDVWIWQDDLDTNFGWTALRPGFGFTDSNFGSAGDHNHPDRPSVDMFGPELTLGQVLADALSDNQIALIKHSQGGSIMDKWSRGNSGVNYSGLLKKRDDVIQSLTDAGMEFEFSGMFWAQGASDAFNSVRGSMYEPNLINFISAIREDFNTPEMPFILSRTHLFENFEPEAVSIDAVRTAQEEVANADPFAVMIDTDDLPIIEDNLHFGTVGQLDHGSRLAAAYLSLFSESTTGDFDTDGDTDGNDFLKWQRGESLSPLSQSDLVAWQDNFGHVASVMTAASTGVPEPSNIILALAVLAYSWPSRLLSLT